MALLAGCGSTNNLDRWHAKASAARCTKIATSAGPPASTLTSAHVAAGTKRPGNATTGDFLGGHCVVTGAIGARTGIDGKPYATGFQLSRPDNWNGRLLYLGGDGNDGTLRDPSLSSSISVGTPSPLGQGYAVGSTDAGHQGGSASLGLDPQARIDHAYASHDKTAVSATELIRQRYGKPPAYAYFSGCSGGGRQDMMFSQRFPGYFNGITAGAPAMRVASGATVAAMWNSTTFSDIAPRDSSGNTILAQAFSTGDLNLVAAAISTACDAADGALDGLVSNTQACRFDPVVLQCMVDWVEKGVAPDAIAACATASHPYFPNRTRPLCAYPTFARDKGSGSIEDAANFSCAQ